MKSGWEEGPQLKSAWIGEVLFGWIGLAKRKGSMMGKNHKHGVTSLNQEQKSITSKSD